MSSSWKMYRRNTKLKDANEVRDGRILFSNNQNDTDYNEPYICLQRRNRWIWEHITNLSAEKFKKYKSNISKNLKNLYEDYVSEMNRHNVTSKRLKRAESINTEAFEFMYNNLNITQRSKFLEKFPLYQTVIDEHTCNICNNISSKEFVGCRFDDCTKMCTDCYSNWKSKNKIKNGVFVFGNICNDSDVCPACNKSQLYTCPICYEDVDEKKVMISDNCDHHICKNCFADSFNSTPIVNCPMCRKQFRKTLGKSNYNDGYPEDIIIV